MLAWHGGGADTWHGHTSPRGRMSGLGDVPRARAFLAKFGLGRAGAVRGAPTEFQADRRSFGGLIWGFEKSCLRRFGGYRQNFQLKWPSMWCSNWAEILCGKVSWVEEHPLKFLHDFHARFGRCFRTRGASWARRGRVVHVHGTFGMLWHCRGGGGTPLGHEQDTLVHF